MKLQKLALASSSRLTELSAEGDFDTESILTSLNAEFYEFLISDDANSGKQAPVKKGKTSKNNIDLPKVDL